MGMTKIIKPKIYTYSGFDDLGKAEVTIQLSKQKFLADVDLRTLNFVIEKWKKRNTRTGEEGFNSQAPTLIFSLSPNEKYKGEVVLCRINGNATGLTSVEQYAVKKAFKFRSRIKVAPKLDSKKSLAVLTEQTVLAIQQRDEQGFEEAFDYLRDFHLLLLKLGEIEDAGKAINYAVMESSWFGSLHNDWARLYKDIFEASANALDDNIDYFKRCSYTAYYLAPGILESKSYTGLDSVLQMQSYLWFRLNEWWETNCDKLSILHGNGNPAELKPPNSKKHYEALKGFIEGWEHLHRYVLSRHAERHTEWASYKNLLSAFNEHLKDSLLYLAKSVITGNQTAAYYWADYLLRWNTNSQPMQQNTGYWHINDAQKIIISPTLLESAWPEVEANLKQFSRFPDQSISPQLVFDMILQNYWQDCCLILSAYLLNWSVDSGVPSRALSTEVIRRLLKGITVDDGSTHGKTIFIENYHDYLTSFLRRHAYHRWNRSSYGSWLDGIARNINNLTERDMMSGRIYTSSGSQIEGTYESDLIMGALVFGLSEKPVDKIAEHYLKLMENEDIASNLVSDLEQRIKSLEQIDPKKYQSAFDAILETENKPAEYQDDGGEKISDAPETEGSVSKNLETVKTTFAALLNLVKQSRETRIRALPILQEKLQEMSEKASSLAFAKETAEFPVYAFNEVEWVLGPLTEFNLRHNNFSKGLITDPQMDHIHYPNDWHNSAVADRLYPYLIIDIFNEAKKHNLLTEITVNNEQEYANKLIELGTLLKSEGFTPLLIAETFRTPTWLGEWDNATWRRDISLPEGISIESKEKRQRSGYISHINDMPLYDGRALTGGTLLLPTEILKKVKFRQLDNGLPVEVTFIEDPNDPWHGSLNYHWERAVELDSRYKIYHIKYPKDITEPQE